MLIELTPEAREAIELLCEHASDSPAKRAFTLKQCAAASATVRALLASPKQEHPIALAKIAKQERVIEDLRIELRSICRNILDGANRGKISGIVPGYLDTVRTALALASTSGEEK